MNGYSLCSDFFVFIYRICIRKKYKVIYKTNYLYVQCTNNKFKIKYVCFVEYYFDN